MVDITKEKAVATTEAAEDANKTIEYPSAVERPSYEELLPLMNAIAKPLASKKMTKKIFKLVKKCAKQKKLTRGVKSVQKALRKKEKGLVVFAGDVSPIDVYSHLPMICEENKLPYCFVPARIDLGLAGQTKRACCVMLLKKDDDYVDAYSEVKEAV